MITPHRISPHRIDPFRIDNTVLQRAIDALFKVPTAYGNAIVHISQVTEELLDSSAWKGKGRDEFQDTYRIVYRYLVDDQDKISSITDMLEGFHQIYEAVDEGGATKIYKTIVPEGKK